jgi:hypothetical protein
MPALDIEHVQCWEGHRECIGTGSKVGVDPQRPKFSNKEMSRL